MLCWNLLILNYAQKERVMLAMAERNGMQLSRNEEMRSLYDEHSVAKGEKAVLITIHRVTVDI